MDIELRGMSAGYDGHAILSDIDLHLEGPGLYCIIGPNGVGKSTLIKCINRIIRPTGGSILLDGEDISGMTQRQIAEKIAYVPVNSEDLFSMSVFETIMIGRSNKQKWRTTPEDIGIVNKAIEVIGLTEFANRPFNELSAGQHQLVAIARGLVQETEIILLDEPTSNLDIRHQIFVTSLLQAIANRNGIMVIMISHNLNIASMFADKVVLMSPPGMIKQVGTASEVMTAENIHDVYNVRCDVVQHEGRPMILLDQVLPFRSG